MGEIVRDIKGLERAGVAQLVERNLPKVDVEGSSPFSRSNSQPANELEVSNDPRYVFFYRNRID